MDRQMHKAARGGDVCRRVLSFNLAEMEKRKLYYIGGYTSTVQYAVLRLQVSRRDARELIVTGQVLLMLDEVDAALRGGRISWTKARLLTRVATKATEAAGLERALASNCADLEREVAMAKKGERPRDDLKGLPEPRVRLDCWLRAVTYEKWELMRSKLSETLRNSTGGREPTDDDLIGYLTELGLSSDPAPATDVARDGAAAPSSSPCSPSVGLLGPSDTSISRVVIHECPKCHEARLSDGTVVSAEELEIAKCDGGAESLSDREDGDPENEVGRHRECGHEHAPGEPCTPESCTAMACAPDFCLPDSRLPHSPQGELASQNSGGGRSEKQGAKSGSKRDTKRDKRSAESLDDPTLPWVRRKVLARDGQSCRCCGRRTGLHVHHIRWRSRNGRTRLANLICVCSFCHALIHHGYLVIEGEDASEVRFLR
ncbi:MAG: HNH endonuclease signature motif containing protein [Planctomycetota bacterium]